MQNVGVFYLLPTGDIWGFEMPPLRYSVILLAASMSTRPLEQPSVLEDSWCLQMHFRLQIGSGSSARAQSASFHTLPRTIPALSLALITVCLCVNHRDPAKHRHGVVSEERKDGTIYTASISGGRDACACQDAGSRASLAQGGKEDRELTLGVGNSVTHPRGTPEMQKDWCLWMPGFQKIQACFDLKKSPGISPQGSHGRIGIMLTFPHVGRKERQEGQKHPSGGMQQAQVSKFLSFFERISNQR